MITLYAQIEFKIRPWKLRDVPDVTAHANNWNIAQNLTDRYPYPYTEDDAKTYINSVIKDDADIILAIEVNGEAIGSIGIMPQSDIYCKNAELGYWLSEPYWNKGIASKAAEWIINFAFNKYDINRIYATVFGTNLASQKVLLKNNFTLEASLENVIFKNGIYQDELIYGLRRAQWENIHNQIL